MSTVVCIPVRNEQLNIEKLLNALHSCEKLSYIFVVSNSVDGTDEIVSSYKKLNDSRVELIKLLKRGKTVAMNTSIRLAEESGCDKLIFVGGDNIPLPGTIDAMVDEQFIGDIGLIGVREVPVDDPKTFLGFLSCLQWNIHHEISKEHPKLSGELFAMKTGILKEMPPAIINDDLYIQNIFDSNGYIVKYLENCGVLLKGAGSLRDFFVQRIRVYIGHHQLRLLLGKAEPTNPIASLRVWYSCLPYNSMIGLLYGVIFIVLQGIAFVSAWFMFHAGRLPFRWEQAKTTKVIG